MPATRTPFAGAPSVSPPAPTRSVPRGSRTSTPCASTEPTPAPTPDRRWFPPRPGASWTAAGKEGGIPRLQAHHQHHGPDRGRPVGPQPAVAQPAAEHGGARRGRRGGHALAHFLIRAVKGLA